MKRILPLILSVLLIFSCLTACGEKGTQVAPIDAKDVQAVTATTALHSSYMYVITDESAIKELVDIYNSVRYESVPEGEAPDILMDTLYSLSFAKSFDNGVLGESITNIGISPKGYVFMTDGVTYKLTSSFDEAKLQSILEKYNIAS